MPDTKTLLVATAVDPPYQVIPVDANDVATALTTLKQTKLQLEVKRDEAIQSHTLSSAEKTVGES